MPRLSTVTGLIIMIVTGPYCPEVTTPSYYTMSSAGSDIFTFLTVYYKYGDYGVRKFKTLREGLQQFLDEYLDGTEHEVGIRRQQLEALTDEDLLTEVLKLGESELMSYTVACSRRSCLRQALSGLRHNVVTV
jgi:hypothetical protein